MSVELTCVSSIAKHRPVRLENNRAAMMTGTGQLDAMVTLTDNGRVNHVTDLAGTPGCTTAPSVDKQDLVLPGFQGFGSEKYRFTKSLEGKI